MGLWIVLSADLNKILPFILSGAVILYRGLWSILSNRFHSNAMPNPVVRLLGVCECCTTPGEEGKEELQLKGLILRDGLVFKELRWDSGSLASARVTGTLLGKAAYLLCITSPCIK